MADKNVQLKDESGNNKYPITYADNVMNKDGVSIQSLVDNLLPDNIVSDVYSSSKTYAKGDYCIRNNTLYRCTTAITTAEAWNSSHWTATQVDDELTSLNSTLANYALKSNALMFQGYINKTDANDLVDSGIYYNTNVVTTNIPSNNVQWCYWIVLHFGDVLTQIIIKPIGPYMIVRERSGAPATWSAWRKITFS